MILPECGGLAFGWMGVSHLETELIKVLFSYCGMALLDASTVSCDESYCTHRGITCCCSAIMEKKKRANGHW